MNRKYLRTKIKKQILGSVETPGVTSERDRTVSQDILSNTVVMSAINDQLGVPLSQNPVPVYLNPSTADDTTSNYLHISENLEKNYPPQSIQL